MLDACVLTDTYWVFYAATTNVGFTVTVTDTETGAEWTSVNADLVAALPVQDVDAFPCEE